MSHLFIYLRNQFINRCEKNSPTVTSFKRTLSIILDFDNISLFTFSVNYLVSLNWGSDNKKFRYILNYKSSCTRGLL